MMKITSGDILVLTSGEYHYYRLCIVCKALVDITDFDKLKHNFFLFADEKNFSYIEFSDWLIQKKIVEKIECLEWYIGAYNEINFEINSL